MYVEEAGEESRVPPLSSRQAERAKVLGEVKVSQELRGRWATLLDIDGIRKDLEEASARLGDGIVGRDRDTWDRLNWHTHRLEDHVTRISTVSRKAHSAVTSSRVALAGVGALAAIEVLRLIGVIG